MGKKCGKCFHVKRSSWYEFSNLHMACHNGRWPSNKNWQRSVIYWRVQKSFNTAWYRKIARRETKLIINISITIQCHGHAINWMRTHQSCLISNIIYKAYGNTIKIHLLCTGSTGSWDKDHTSFNEHSSSHKILHSFAVLSLVARFMGPTWGPSGADRTQMGPLLAPWTLLSGLFCHGAHLGRTGPRWAPCWPHELCYLGIVCHSQKNH